MGLALRIFEGQSTWKLGCPGQRIRPADRRSSGPLTNRHWRSRRPFNSAPRAGRVTLPDEPASSEAYDDGPRTRRRTSTKRHTATRTDDPGACVGRRVGTPLRLLIVHQRLLHHRFWNWSASWSGAETRLYMEGVSRRDSRPGSRCTTSVSGSTVNLVAPRSSSLDCLVGEFPARRCSLRGCPVQTRACPKPCSSDFP